MSWPRAAILPAEPEDFVCAVARAAAQGFTHVEVAALADRPAVHLDALADAGVFVACAALSGRLATSGVEARRALFRALSRQVADAARLGAACVVVTPDVAGAGGESAFAELCGLLAEYAAGRMVRLAVASLPGSCLPDAPAVRSWLQRCSAGNLGLALEDDDPAGVRQAGAALFHVRLREPAPSPELLAALAEVDYRGAISVLPPAGP